MSLFWCGPVWKSSYQGDFLLLGASETWFTVVHITRTSPDNSCYCIRRWWSPPTRQLASLSRSRPRSSFVFISTQACARRPLLRVQLLLLMSLSSFRFVYCIVSGLLYLSLAVVRCILFCNFLRHYCTIPMQSIAALIVPDVCTNEIIANDNREIRI